MINKTAVEYFLNFSKGEWPLRPNYGLDLKKKLFEEIGNIDDIKNFVKNEIESFFKINVDVEIDKIEKNSIKINITLYDDKFDDGTNNMNIFLNY